MSGYGHIVDRSLVSSYPEGSEMREFHCEAHEYVKAYILREKSSSVEGTLFPCFLGEAAVRTGQYTFEAYDDIADESTTEGIMHDIIRSQHELEIPADPARTKRIYRSTLIAFKKPVIQNNLHAAEVLFTLFQNLHDLNAQHYPWAAGFSHDIESPNFGYSTGETASFVAYFHPHAINPVRRTPYQFFVLNSHHVLDELKQAKGMEGFNSIRDRIRSLQAHPDPRAGNHGEANEFDQYAFTSLDPVVQSKERLLKRAIFGECSFGPPNSIKD